jgi:ACT domain-containing protein
MIQKPNEIMSNEKKIRMLIAGSPGIGKTTVGLSAPNPLHIDVDRGLDRVQAQYRRDYIQPQSYGELKADLELKDNPKISNLNAFDSLVFDTGGQLVKLMASWAISTNLKNGNREGSLSLPGYGVVGREFERLMNHCFYTLQKNVVVIFHSKEEKDGDNTKLRLLVEGQTKDNVWQPMDLGGFIEMQGNNRMIGFSNCERYYAKGTHGIEGVVNIPRLDGKAPNVFLTKLFEQINVNIAKETEDIEKIRGTYEEAILEATRIIEEIKDAGSANKTIKEIKKIKHALTSEREIRMMFAKKALSLKLTLDKEKGVYIAQPSDDKDVGAA